MSQCLYMCVMCAGLLTACVSAQVWYINPEGSSGQTGSPEQPFATIQQAMDVIDNGDSIVLMPGIYTGAGNYDLRSAGLSMTIRSMDPNNWGVIAATVIDPKGAGGVFEFTNGQGLVTIEGLTLQNAVKEYPPYDEPHGAAIFGKGVEMVIHRCIFQNCQADLGGAVYFNDSQAALSHCIFAGNNGWDGGAVMSDEGSNIQMTHCTFAGNTGYFYGGGVSCEFTSTLAITNSIFWGNRLIESSGQGQEIFAIGNSTVMIGYSAIEDGAGGTYSDSLSSIFLEAGVLDIDPLFAYFEIGVSPFLWDLRLKSVFGRWDDAFQEWVSDTENSPCIDAGTENANYSREPWPNGRRVNIGAYGNTEQASLFGNIADLDIDGRVDIADLAILASVWQNGPLDYEDFDGSEAVDLSDLLIMAENWLWVMSAL